MGSQEHLPAAVFAPSPPLTTSPGASDCDVEGDKPSRRRRPQAPEGEPSPSSSFTSADPSVARPRSDLDTAFELVRAAWQGTLPDDLPCPEWHVLTISPSQFLDLRERLEKEGLLKYFESLRHDYNPDRSELVLRLMETALHACMTERVRDAIISQLRKLCPQPDGSESDPAQSDAERGPDAALSDYDSGAILSRLASKINTYGHMKIRLQAETGPATKSPDGQLCYDKNLPSQFVIEIGYSQNSQSLQQVAKDLYEDSDGKVKTVLTIDITYSDSDVRRGVPGSSTSAPVDRSARYCLYRGPERVHHNQAFQDAEGRPVADGDLHLYLSDFIPDATLKQLRPQQRARVKQCPITISARRLSRSLREAEEMQAVEDTEVLRGKNKKPRRPGNPRRPAKRVLWDVDVDAREDGNAEAKDDDVDQQAPKRPKTRLSEADRLYQGAVGQAAGGKLPERRRTRSESRASSRHTRSQSRNSAGQSVGPK